VAEPCRRLSSVAEGERTMRKLLIFAVLALVVLLAIVQFGPAIILGR
jgi:hypothetical protein